MKNPVMRTRVVEALAEVLPLPADCPHCDPAGGCPDPGGCVRGLAEQVLDLIEREAGLALERSR